MNRNVDIERNIKNIKKKTVLLFLVILIIIFLFGYGGKKYFLDELFKPSEELIIDSSSFDGTYNIKAYIVNGGATVDWAIRCYLTTNNKHKKIIYYEYHVNDVKINWVDNDTVIINDHKIDLPDGKYERMSE